MFNTVIVGADLVAKELATFAVGMGTRERAIVAHYGALYQTRVKAGVSGRPGLRVITGDYRRSITMEMGFIAGGSVATIGTNHPAARRHEYGWPAGKPDSLGRMIPTPPRPHFEPPLERTVNEMQAALAAAVDAGIK